MDWLWNLLFLMAAAQSIQAQIQLVQSGSELKKPGETVKISCKASGDTFTKFGVNWVKQPPGMGLKWMAWINSDTGESAYGEDFRRRFAFSLDSSGSTAYLQINNLTNEDTATYFCGRLYFDYWGQGTALTVSSGIGTVSELPRGGSTQTLGFLPEIEEKSTIVIPLLWTTGVKEPQSPSPQPSLSLQRPALEDLLLGSDASITCTLNGLRNPEGAVFTWEPSTGKDAVQKKAVQNSCGCYSVSSVLPGCAERWNSGASFKCTVTHPESGTLTGTIAKVTVNTFPPQVHLLPPPSEELALNELLSLTCLVRAFNPKEVLVRWLHGNEELSPESYLVFEPLKEPGEGATTYLVTSVLRVSAETWKQGDQYSCMVGHEALPMNFTQKTIDRLSGKPTNVSVSVIMSEGDGICY